MDSQFYDGQKRGYELVIKKVDELKEFYKLKGYGIETLMTIRDFCENSIIVVDGHIGKEYRKAYNELKEKGETNGND